MLPGVRLVKLLHESAIRDVGERRGGGERERERWRREPKSVCGIRDEERSERNVQFAMLQLRGNLH
jgi:hypothetical protein